MALDVDYAALWRRAEHKIVEGRRVLTLAPEDTFLVLAIHGGKEMWWNIKWACDIAALIQTPFLRLTGRPSQSARGRKAACVWCGLPPSSRANISTRSSDVITGSNPARTSDRCHDHRY